MPESMDATVDKCLAFCQALAKSNQKFSINLTFGKDNFSFNNKELATSSWQMKKKKSPSQLRREAKRREACDKEVAGKVADKEIPSSKETLKVAEKKVTHWQTKQWLSGLRPGRPVDNGPQEGDYSAWVV